MVVECGRGSDAIHYKVQCRWGAIYIANIAVDPMKAVTMDASEVASPSVRSNAVSSHQ